MDDFIKWSQNITDNLTKKNNKYIYKIHLTIGLNPLNYDGINKFLIEIYRYENDMYSKNKWLEVEAKESTIDECMKNIDKKLQLLGELYDRNYSSSNV